MPSVMITGVNRGIGLELLRQYADAGWSVVGTCRKLSAAGDAAAIASDNQSITLHELDVADTAAVKALADEMTGTAIDVLILNAGVMGDTSMRLGELDEGDFLRVLNVNVVAQAMCLQAFAPHVAASDKKVIVGMGSFLGSMGSNTDGSMYSYRASKAGLHAIMVSASHDLRDKDVISIVMHPGWVQTDMGGPDATITTGESATGIRKVIDGLSLPESGRLFTYAGETLPW